MNTQLKDQEFDAGECLIARRWNERVPKLGPIAIHMATIDRCVTGAIAVVQVLAADRRRAGFNDAGEDETEPRLAPVVLEGLDLAVEELLMAADRSIEYVCDATDPASDEGKQ